jgi:hypothetical protein
MDLLGVSWSSVCEIDPATMTPKSCDWSVTVTAAAPMIEVTPMGLDRPLS